MLEKVVTGININKSYYNVNSSSTYFGTTTSSVCRYSDSGTKCSFLTRSDSDRVIRLPLEEKEGKEGIVHGFDDSSL